MSELLHVPAEPTGANSALIDIHSVVVEFKDVIAVDHVSLSLGRGVTGLLGPNGAGKTTLLKTLATIQVPTAGSVTIMGQPVNTTSGQRAIRQHLGYLPQKFGFFPRFTVAEYLAYFAWLKMVPSSTADGEVSRVLSAVDMKASAGRKMRTLSGGMLQRVGIAQAIMGRPGVVLLDEPSSGLDPVQRVDLRGLLKRVGEESCVIVSTHLIEDVTSVCDELVIMRQGAVAFHGSTRDFTEAEPRSGVADGMSPAERAYSSVLRNRSGSL